MDENNLRLKPKHALKAGYWEMNQVLNCCINTGTQSLK